MAIQPSEEINNLFMVLTGSRMPDINEDMLRTVQDQYLEVSADLGELQTHVEFLVVGVRRSFDGQAAEAFAMRMEQFVSGDVSVLDGAAEQARALAAFAGEVATEAEYMKLMIIAELIVLLAEIAIAVAMAYFSFGLSTALLPIKFAITRMMIRLGMQRLIMRIVSSPLFKTVVDTPWFQSFVNSPWFKTAAQGVFIYGPIDGVIELGMSGGVQDYQIRKGHRKDVNDKHLTSSLISGYFSGAIQHFITANLLRKFLPPLRSGRDGPGGFDLDPPGGGPGRGAAVFTEKSPPPVGRGGAGDGPRKRSGPDTVPGSNVGPDGRPAAGPSPMRHLRLPIVLTSVGVGTAIGETIGEVISGAAVYGRVDIDPEMPGLAAGAAAIQAITELKLAQPLGNWLGRLSFGPPPVVTGGPGSAPSANSSPPPAPGQTATERNGSTPSEARPVDAPTPERTDRSGPLDRPGPLDRSGPEPITSGPVPRPPVVSAPVVDSLAPVVSPPPVGPAPTEIPSPPEQMTEVRQPRDTAVPPVPVSPEPPPSSPAPPAPPRVVPPPAPADDPAWSAARDEASVGVREHFWGDPAHQFGPEGDQQLVVRSGFDVRRVFHEGQWFTDLEVRVWINDTTGVGPAGIDAIHQRLAAGLHEHVNSAGHLLGNGDQLHVTVLRADSPQSAHQVVDLVDRDQQMHQYAWWADAAGEYYTHELMHQLGLRDDRSGTGSIPGSLLGDFTAPKPTDDGTTTPADNWHLWRDGGLRQRHLALLDRLIGPVGDDGGYHGVDRPVRPVANEHAPRAPGQSPTGPHRPATTSNDTTSLDGQPGMELDDLSGRPRPVPPPQLPALPPPRPGLPAPAPPSGPGPATVTGAPTPTPTPTPTPRGAVGSAGDPGPSSQRPPVVTESDPVVSAAPQRRVTVSDVESDSDDVEDSDVEGSDLDPGQASVAERTVRPRPSTTSGDLSDVGDGSTSRSPVADDESSAPRPDDESSDSDDQRTEPRSPAEEPVEESVREPAQEPVDLPDDPSRAETSTAPPVLPWYTDPKYGGALGQMYAYQAGPPPGGRVDNLVDELLQDLVSDSTFGIFTASARDAIRRAAREALIDLYTPPAVPAAPADGSPDPFIDDAYSEFLEKWDQVLVQGITVEAGGRLVWIRPVVTDGRPHQRTRTGPAPYKVVFGSGSANTSEDRESNRGIPAPIDLMLVALSGFGKRLSRLMFNFPARLDGTYATPQSRNRTLVTGRQMFVKKTTMFDAGLRFDVYADGLSFGTTATLPPSRSGLVVVVPQQYTSRDNGWPGGTEKSPPQQEEQRPTRARPVLNAIGLTPLVLQWHRQLAASKLTPRQRVGVAAVGTAQLLNERSLINRSTHLMSGGVRTDALSAEGVTGSLKLTVEPLWVQYIGSAPEVEVRDDMSMVTSLSEGASASSGLAFDPSVTAISLVHPTTSPVGDTGQRVTGTFGVEGEVSSGESMALDLSSDVSNHVVLVRRADQARYYMQYRAVLTTELDNFKIPQVGRSGIPAELGVAEPDRRRFERDLTGGALSDGIQHQARKPPTASRMVQDDRLRRLRRLLGLEPEEGTPRAGWTPQRRTAAGAPVAMPHHHGRRITAPTATESLALATRRGTGWGVPVSLPGSEVVVPRIEEALKSLAGVKTLDSDTTRRINELSRPALEADLNRHLVGDPFTVTVNGKKYDILLTVSLEEHLDSDRYPMNVNTRTIISAGHSSTTGSELSWGVGFTGGPVIPLTKNSRFGLPFSLRKVWSSGRSDTRSVAVESYRRTETTGDVVDNGYRAAYQLVIREATAGAPRHRWSFGGEVGIVTPVEHLPDTPLTLEQVDQANTVTAGDTARTQWTALREGIDSVDFVRFDQFGVNAVETAFVTMPEAVAVAADLYRQTTGKSQEWFDDPLNWPRELWQIGIPNHLNAHFGELTDGSGWIISLDEGLTTHRVLIVRARVVPPGTGRVSHSVEIEHYLKRASKREQGSEKGSDNKFGVAPTGSYLVPHPSGDDEAAIGRVDGEVAGPSKKRSTGQEISDSVGSADISRATYGGDKGIYQGDVLLEMSIVEWNDLKDFFAQDKPDAPASTTRTEYLKVPSGLDFMMPVETARDLSLLLPSTAAATEEAPPPGAAPTVTPPPAAPLYVDPDLAQATSHPERLQADEVLTVIEKTMREQGLIPAGNRYTKLRRAVRSQFSSRALESQEFALRRTGVRGLFVVPGPFRNLRLMQVKVTGRLVGEPTSSGNRQDVDLLLRAEALDGSSRSDSKGDEWSWTVVKAKGYGKPTSATDAGASGGVTYSRENESDIGMSRDGKDIFRIGIKGGSTQFVQRMEFEVWIGLTNHKPYWMQLISSAIREAFFLANSLYTGGGQWARQVWFDNRVIEWDWQVSTPKPLSGEMKLLVPMALAETADQRGSWVSTTTGRPDGFPATPRERWSHRPEVRPQANRDLLADPTLQPRFAKIASVVQQYGGLVNASTQLPPSAVVDGKVPGLPWHSEVRLALDNDADDSALQVRLPDLLGGGYQIPGTDVTMTVDVQASEYYRSSTGDPLTMKGKGRRYGQNETTPSVGHSRSSATTVTVGPSGRGDVVDGTRLGTDAPFTVGASHETGGETSIADVSERNLEDTRDYYLYRYDVTVYLTGPAGTLAIDVPGGFLGWSASVPARLPTGIPPSPGGDVTVDPEPGGQSRITPLDDESDSDVEPGSDNTPAETATENDPIFAALTPSSVPAGTAPTTPTDVAPHTPGPAELTQGADHRWYLDGQEVLSRRLTGNRTGAALLDDADLEQFSPEDVLPPGELPVVAVHADGARITVPVRGADGRTRQVPVTPVQLATMTAPLANRSGSVALITCGVGVTDGGFVSAYATALNADVLAPVAALRIGSTTSPHAPLQVPVSPEDSASGRPWRLFTPEDLGGDGWDTLNDGIDVDGSDTLNRVVDIDGFRAVDGPADDDSGLVLGTGPVSYGYPGQAIDPGGPSSGYGVAPTGQPTTGSTIDTIWQLNVPPSMSDVPQWIRSRVDQGLFPVPFLVDDAMDPAASKVRWGVEIEFVLPANDRDDQGASQSVDDRLAEIGARLQEAGLIESDEPEDTHSPRRPGMWSFQLDDTVDGEIISPVLTSSPQTWRTLLTIEQILSAAGAQVRVRDLVTVLDEETGTLFPDPSGATITMESGGHVHVGSGFFARHTGALGYAALAGLYHQHEEVLYRLAGDPRSDIEHGFAERKPGWDPTMPYPGDAEAAIDAHRDRKLGLSFNQVSLTDYDHPEWRLFRGSLLAAVIQTQVKIAVGMQLAALQLARSGAAPPTTTSGVGRLRRSGSAPSPYGGWSVHDGVDLTDYAPLWNFLGTAFSRRQDMLQAAALFFLNDWAPPPDGSPATRYPYLTPLTAPVNWPTGQLDVDTASHLLDHTPPTASGAEPPVHDASRNDDDDWQAGGVRAGLRSLPGGIGYALLSDGASTAGLPAPGPVPSAMAGSVPVVVRLDGGTVRLDGVQVSQSYQVRVGAQQVAGMVSDTVDYRQPLRLVPVGSGKLTDDYVRSFAENRPPPQMRGLPQTVIGDVYVPASHLFTPPAGAVTDPAAPSWVRFYQPYPGGQWTTEIVADAPAAIGYGLVVVGGVQYYRDQDGNWYLPGPADPGDPNGPRWYVVPAPMTVQNPTYWPA
ncbi:hypothetical protein O7623_03665 [Solwaraspora sp. WMMD791]|uniref:WXG100-like domain-containing protein n=1 Tax=Solwaraspora sp. WMMD791 TaxID=3016086 RepID=UPI00249A5E9C|nr:hypothetical protein [Solwaraspora sp. WMMD791]WFE28320.1 hypothetical protein O7623_03665 [Solwaraspora sp. WMMD791]